ncbi:MAG: META domain-containing protein [Yoonia sp.]|nr:META domain-containing protein [Yoonia sp.]
MKYLIALAFIMTAACQADESVTAFTDGVTTFALQSIDGTAFASTATIDVSVAGKITGRGPCNRYFADQTAPYPWFSLGAIGSTRMACPDLAAEAQFFDALRTMTLVEILGGMLILSDDKGRQMLFQAP